MMSSEFGQGRDTERQRRDTGMAVWAVLFLAGALIGFALYALFMAVELWLSPVERPDGACTRPAFFTSYHSNHQGGFMADKNAKGDWIDARGKEVPPQYVDPVIKRRDALVEKHFKVVNALSAKMKEAKQAMHKDIEAYVDFLNKSNGVKENKSKGNLQLTNFTGNRQIEIDVNEVQEFDERLQVAKALIDSCLNRWSEGGNEKVRVVIQDAFNIDKKGKVNSKMIMSLRKLKFNDKEWNDAMDLINESINVAGTRQYANFRVRPTVDAQWHTLSLNFSTL